MQVEWIGDVKSFSESLLNEMRDQCNSTVAIISAFEQATLSQFEKTSEKVKRRDELLSEIVRLKLDAETLKSLGEKRSQLIEALRERAKRYETNAGISNSLCKKYHEKALYYANALENRLPEEEEREKLETDVKRLCEVSGLRLRPVALSEQSTPTGQRHFGVEFTFECLTPPCKAVVVTEGAHFVVLGTEPSLTLERQIRTDNLREAIHQLQQAFIQHTTNSH